jgi:hypothetical protein
MCPRTSIYTVCVLVLLYMCPRTTIYTSSPTQNVRQKSALHKLGLTYIAPLYMCPRTTIYVCPRTTIYVVRQKSALHKLRLTYMCPRTTIYVSSYYYMCPHPYCCICVLLQVGLAEALNKLGLTYCDIGVLILLYMCPHTAVCVSSYCHTSWG